MIAAKNRPVIANPQRENVTPEQYKAIAQGVAAQFGTWSVNEADKTLIFHSEEGLFPRPAGGRDQKQTIVSVTADEMKTSSPTLGNATYRRFK